MYRDQPRWEDRFLTRRDHMKLSSIIITTIAFLLLAVAGIARAQDKEARKHPSGEPSIITRDYIQAELKLSDDQKLKLQKASPDFRKVLDSREKTWAFLEEIPGRAHFESQRI